MRVSKESVQTIVARRYDEAGAVIAWTDGSCHPNPGGPGGWGFRLEAEGREPVEGYGGEPSSTNNRMEMLAVVQALEATPESTRVIVRTDSQLVVLCGVGRWRRKANLDLWQRVARACACREVEFEWWRGHCGTPGNERVDELAGKGRAENTRPAEEPTLVDLQARFANWSGPEVSGTLL